MPGKAVVFIHGLGLGEWIFQRHYVPYYTARGYEVHTFDLPGHSAHSSTEERQRVTLDACVRFTENYLAANLALPYVLVGMSTGGAICQRLLASDSNREGLRGLVLLSSVPPINNLIFTLRLCRSLAAGHPEVLIDFFRAKLHAALMFSPRSLSRLGEEEAGAVVGKILQGFSRLEFEIFFQDLLSQPLRIDLPLKVIGGGDDLLFSPEVAHFTASYYHTEAEIVPGMGHMIPIEPDHGRSLEILNAFLEKTLDG